MSALVAYKSLIVMALATAVVFAVPRLRPALKHALWLMALMAVSLLPALAAVSFAPAHVVATTLSLAPEIIAAATHASAHAHAWSLVWLVGAALSLLRLAASALSLHFWRQTTRPTTAFPGAPVNVRVHSQLASPVAVGILRRTIVMPVAALEWPQSLQQAALAHEIAHVRRHDCATQLFAQIVRAIFWFNPFVWLAERAMRRERELACDAFAVAGGLKSSAYAEWLLSLHVSPPRALIASMEGGGLHQRIAHLLTPRRRLPRTLEVAALTSFLAVALILGCGKRAPTFAVTTEPITPVASMDPALIKGAIREHRDEFRACYENELAHTPTLGGTIKTQFIIGNDGAVTSSAISDSSMGSAAVEGCIAQVESRILFPKPKGNGSITVNYPFAFAPY